jgi:hypothetical protein
VTDPDEPFGRDMHQKPPEELFAGDRDLFPLPLIFIIFGSEGNRAVCHRFDPIVADRDPMGIFSQVADNRFSAIKWLLTVRHPFFVVTGIQKFFENIMVAIRFCSAVKLKLSVFPQLF